MKVINCALEYIRNRIVREGVIGADDQCDLMYMLYMDMEDAFGRRDANPTELGTMIWQAVQIGINTSQFEMVQLDGRGADVLLSVPDQTWDDCQLLDKYNPARFKHLSATQSRYLIDAY